MGTVSGMFARRLAPGFLALLAGSAGATPSTLVWTPCTEDIQSFGVVHVSYDNYTTIGEKGPGSGGETFANDLGLTVGVLSFGKWHMEAGFDWFEPSDWPLMFNAKFGAPEGALFAGAPGIAVGVFGIGTKRGVTDQNVVDIVAGHGLPGGAGRLHVGGYTGNADLFVSGTGKKENAGFMVGWDLGLWTVKAGGEEFSRIVLAADWMSGRNVLGAGGAAVAWCFSPNASVLMGPVWFNDRAINGKWKWTTQFDGNF